MLLGDVMRGKSGAMGVGEGGVQGEGTRSAGTLWAGDGRGRTYVMDDTG